MPPRFPPIGKFGTIDFMENCLGCSNCVKKRSCIYNLYRDEYETMHGPSLNLEYLYMCKNCFRCVQECTKGLLKRVINPEYENMGDDYWTCDIIETTWYQSETGKIPVSGAGYRGPFAGGGFDSMWTDMSEIVRPTRDGIHGREYISTTVDFGRTAQRLDLNDLEKSFSEYRFTELPVPLIFDLIPNEKKSPGVLMSALKAAHEMGTLMIMRPEEIIEEHQHFYNAIIPTFESTEVDEYKYMLKQMRAAEFPYSENIVEKIGGLDNEYPDLIKVVRLQADKNTLARSIELASNKIDVIHIVADSSGLESGEGPRFIKDLMREIHTDLVGRCLRDSVTFVTSGGVALAEHMAKGIICGADLVAIDLPLMVALECRLCKKCSLDTCPVEFNQLDSDYGKQRIMNLIAAWHNQLLEVLGAMGIREARRLRGETGRAMFFEDLEEETFGKIFGEKKKNIYLAVPGQ
jgi:ferredoxin